MSMIGCIGQKTFPNAEVIEYNKDLNSSIRTALENNGYRLLEFGTRTKSNIEERKSYHEEEISRIQRYKGTKPCNTLHDDVGFYRDIFDEEIENRLKLVPYPAIQIISTLHVVVAEKITK